VAERERVNFCLFISKTFFPNYINKQNVPPGITAGIFRKKEKSLKGKHQA